MLRKSGLFVIFVLILGVIAACGSDNNSGSNAEQPGNEAEEKQEEDTYAEDNTENKEEAEKQEPKYYISEETSAIIPTDDADENVVLLTIDDAPDKNALEMAETLKEKEVKAIFFVNGHFLDDEEGAEKLKQIHDMGFPIGNHTYTHAKLPDISEEEQTEEIVALNDRIEEIIGERPAFFRAPHGANTDYSRSLAEQEGMVLMNWTYGYDYFEPYEDAEKLTEAMITGEGPEVDVNYSLLQPGANLLMHDRDWTKEALGDIVDGLREQGYEIADPALIQTIQ